LEKISDRYGRWQDRECKELKQSLMQLEEGRAGRVRLHAFYASALEGTEQFSETKEYLRQLGALDESGPHASVIIPNYINAPSNCAGDATSKFYSVCCINECEALLGHLELRVAAPEAAPERILQLVAALPSATVGAPRTLPDSLSQRLREIAVQHGGAVPLHSRLFAQWMHRAYPRECPYPHLSGTTKPLTTVEYRRQTGREITADKDTMRWHVEEARQLRSREASQQEEEMPWSAEEELFVSRHPAEREGRSGSEHWAVGRGLKFAVVVVAMSMTLAHAFLTVRCELVSGPKGKFYI